MGNYSKKFHELCTQEKGKYELISGQWKTTDEVISMYFDLLTHSNGTILGFIDPLHPKVKVLG